MELTEIAAQLAAPFDVSLVELKPGATNGEKTRALALAYVDARAYQDRLDAAAGPAGWSVEYRPMPAGVGIICRLVVLGIVREDVGEAPEGDANRATSAAMQAFKRACAAFGLGRYLYHLPQLWLPCEQAGRSVRFVDAAAGIRQIYRQAGIGTPSQATHRPQTAERYDRH